MKKKHDYKAKTAYATLPYSKVIEIYYHNGEKKEQRICLQVSCPPEDPEMEKVLDNVFQLTWEKARKKEAQKKVSTGVITYETPIDRTAEADLLAYLAKLWGVKAKHTSTYEVQDAILYKNNEPWIYVELKIRKSKFRKVCEQEGPMIPADKVERLMSLDLPAMMIVEFKKTIFDRKRQVFGWRIQKDEGITYKMHNRPGEKPRKHAYIPWDRFKPAKPMKDNSYGR